MLTLRLGLHQIQADRARELAEAVTRQKGSCDEVWLTTRGMFPPMEFHKGLANDWVQAADIFRKAGLRVSLQIANTLGHRDWASTHPDKNDYFAAGMRENGELYDLIAGPDGTVCHSCFCWRGERFRKYICELIETYAKTLRPDCIWLDDDLRMHRHIPVVYSCFCDRCIADFNAQYGTAYTREALVQEINYGNTLVREQYLSFSMQGMRDFLFAVVKACHAVSPHTHFGLEYARTADFPAMSENYIIEALHDASGMPVELRPGGGFYNDKDPYGAYEKAFLLSFETAGLPAYVSSVKAELENLPGVAFGKSIGGIINEGTLHLAYGCTGLTFTDVQSCHEPMAYYERIFARFKEMRPYWEKLSNVSASAARGGAVIYRGKTAHLRPIAADAEPFSWATIPEEADFNWWRIGLPFTFDHRAPAAYILHHTLVDGLTDGDIAFLLSKPVIADAQSVHALIQRGYGAYFDFTLQEIDDPDAAEDFTAHPINGKWAGNFLRENPYATKPMRRFAILDAGKDTALLGTMRTSNFAATHKTYGGSAAVTRIRRTDGKEVKWAVFGYSIWSDLTSAAKRNQLAGALDAITVMPARLGGEEQAALIPSVNENGKTVAVTVSSLSQSGTDQMDLLVRRPAGDTVTCFTSRGRVFQPTLVSRTKKEYTFRLPPIDPYELVTLFFE